VLLTLASAALTLSPAAEDEVVRAIENWWSARPATALLHFLLDAIDLLSRRVADISACETLWFAGCDIVRRESTSLSPADRDLWRWIGQRIGLSAADIDVYLPLPSSHDSEQTDPIAGARLKKIALFWREEPAARTAAQRLAERAPGAEIVIVAEQHPRAQTSSALNADVLLIVWRNISHAVFRALDGISRRKLAYVAGEGASSIERALEKWVQENRSGTTEP
jgi:hypothetical protein